MRKMMGIGIMMIMRRRMKGIRVMRGMGNAGNEEDEEGKGNGKWGRIGKIRQELRQGKMDGPVIRN
jgi:hypothetical protein